jgi:hypothetical protein
MSKFLKISASTKAISQGVAFFCYLCEDMINTVRNTVMAILNKDNNGYITPEEFNLFAKQAQLEIFEQYFYDYTNWVNKRNARLANDGYANIQKNFRNN